MLTDTSVLPATVSGYLAAKKMSVSSGYAYGGSAVIADATLTAAQMAYT